LISKNNLYKLINMNEKQKRIVDAAYQKGLSPAAISSTTGIPVGDVNAYLGVLEPVQAACDDGADVMAMIRSGIPSLVKRALELAQEEKSLSAVTKLLADSMDRIYGKPVQVSNITGDINSHVTHSGVGDADLEIIKRFYAEFLPVDHEQKLN